MGVMLELIDGVDPRMWSDVALLHDEHPGWDKGKLIEEARKILNSDIRSEGIGGNMVEALCVQSFEGSVINDIDVRRDAEMAAAIERGKEEYARRLAVGKQVIQGWLDKTSEDTREGYEWWVLIEVEKYAYETVAKMAKEKVGTVKSRVSRVREALDDLTLKARISHIITSGSDVIMARFQEIRDIALDHELSDQVRWTRIGDLLKEVPEEHQNTSFYHLAMAQKQWQHDGNYSEAESHLGQALKWAVDNIELAKVYNEIGLVAEVQGRYEEYLRFVYRACEHDPSHPSYRHNLLEAGSLLSQHHTIRIALRQIVAFLKSDKTPVESKNYLRSRMRENPKLNGARPLRDWTNREKYWQEEA